MRSVPDAIALVCAESDDQRRCARRLAASLREFGGALAGLPIWWCEPEGGLPSVDVCFPAGMRRIAVRVPPSIAGFPFGLKAAACAQAEMEIGREVRSILVFSAESLVLRPPSDMLLSPPFSVALRPVHIRNIGLLAGEPPDPFWEGIDRVVAPPAEPSMVKSFVDRQILRAYFNAGVFSADPAAGLFARWLEAFSALAADSAFQERACADGLHRIFLHQAVWSAVVDALLPPAHRRMLPPAYGYPLHLHEAIPPGDQAAVSGGLVCPIYDDPAVLAGWETRMELGGKAREFLRRWNVAGA